MGDRRPINLGKLPPDALKKLLAKAKMDPSVLVGPAYGEDAAAVRFGGKVFVAASDPVTFTTDRIGHYAVCVNANDIAVMGAAPRWFLAAILLPESCAEADAEAIFDQINHTCEKLGVALIGGHTEITDGVIRPVVCGTMLGETDESSLVTSGGARVGDTIILAGGVAIEGTSILAREAGEDLLRHGVSPELVQRAQAFLDDPGICIVNHARTAVQAGGVTSMHDPTEGGIATALRELAAASNVGVEIARDRIPILPECEVVCSALGLDPLGLIASGCLLVTAGPASADAILRAFDTAGVQAARTGVVRRAGFGIRYSSGPELPEFARDEIARYFGQGGAHKER